jgi:conjugal transfer/type IV secretion protein DotA/TraY
MSGPFTPSQNDGAVEMLRAVFGSVIDTIVGATSAGSVGLPTMLSEGYRFFNSGVLLFGTFLLAAVTVMGVTNTANDGEALGRKWSTLYTPLRTLVAASSLVPTASGYAGIQILMLLIVCNSVGFASNLWTSVVKYSVADDVAGQALSSMTNDPRFETLAAGALKMQVCAQAVNQSVNALGLSQPVQLAMAIQRDEPSVSTTLWPGSGKPFLGKSLTYRTRIFFQDPQWPSSADICGRIVFTDTFDAPATTSAAASEVARSIQEAIVSIRQRHVENLFQPNHPIEEAAKQISAVASGTQASFRSQVIRDALDYTWTKLSNETVQEISKQLQDKNSDVTAKLAGKGWIYAGSLYLELARIKDAVRNATITQAEYIEGSAGLKGLLSGDVEHAASAIFDTHMVILSTALKKSQSLPVAAIGNTPRLPVLSTSVGAADFADGGNGVKTMITSWTNGLSTSMLSGMVHYMSDSDLNPIFKVKNVGDWLSSGALTAMTSQAVLSASLEGLKDGAAAESNQQIVGIPMGVLAGYASTAGALLGKLWGHISPAMTSILYAGHYLGSWIPLIPFFVFALAVVGWVIFVGEMLAASVLWMAAHVTPSTNDSFIGSQAQGYLLVVSGFFRPALTVLGLVFSLAALGPIVQFINSGFLLAVMAAQADSVTGLFSLASFSLCYCFLISVVFYMVFSLPQTFPDRILRWVGAGIGDMGEQQTMARLESGASTQARAAAVAGAAHFASKATGDNDRAGREQGAAEEALSASLRASSPEGIAGQSTAFAPGDSALSSDKDPSPEY